MRVPLVGSEGVSFGARYLLSLEAFACGDSAKYTAGLQWVSRTAARTLCNFSLRTASGPEGSSAK